MKDRVKTWALRVLRWGIAIAGIWYVLSQISLYDRVMILGGDNRPRMVRTDGPADENAKSFAVRVDGQVRRYDASELWTTANPDRLVLEGKKLRVLAIKPTLPNTPGEKFGPVPRELLVEKDGQPQLMPGSTGGYRVSVPYPLVEIGLARRVRAADPMFLWLSIFIFPLTFIITSVRWHALLKALGIRMPLVRAVTLNMVGAFYNTFMPGSTGGDVLKAWYAAKQTPKRTYAVMSVIVDRAIGLLALIVLGGAMAGYQYLTAADKNDPVAQSCLKIALICVAILVCVAGALEFAFSKTLRRIFFVDKIIARLPMQRQVQKVIEVMRIYRSRPMLVIGALLGTLPVHATVVVSAIFACFAFNLFENKSLNPLYFFAAVPVIVLVGSIPISPQGAGVMEFFAIRLTERHGVSVGEAFILTMSIRLVQILWNLVGGIFVLRGGYHAPSESEQKELNEDQPVESPAESPEQPAQSAQSAPGARP